MCAPSYVVPEGSPRKPPPCIDEDEAGNHSSSDGVNSLHEDNMSMGPSFPGLPHTEPDPLIGSVSFIGPVSFSGPVSNGSNGGAASADGSWSPDFEFGNSDAKRRRTKKKPAKLRSNSNGAQDPPRSILRKSPKQISSSSNSENASIDLNRSVAGTSN
ncbi:hypothetical protein LXL04_011939 [Taraxacum kok-saghyz]